MALACHVMSFLVIPCHVMSCYVMLCYVMLCYVMPCYVMYVILCYTMLCYAMLCYVMSCHVMSCQVLSCHVMLCYVTLRLKIESLSAEKKRSNSRRSSFARRWYIVKKGEGQYDSSCDEMIVPIFISVLRLVNLKSIAYDLDWRPDLFEFCTLHMAFLNLSSYISAMTILASFS